MTLQADGKILLGGGFTSIAGQARNGIARLNNNAATRSITASNSQVQWARGGSSPEVEQVTFELSTDGGANWTLLGAGSRITGGWERTGLNLPASGQLRARGRTVSGENNGSSGLIEYIAPFPGGDFTLTPTLSLPSTGMVTKSPVPVSFDLPENALAGSVMLRFGANTLVLAASQQSAGHHAFSFDPANPVASPQIDSGSPIADGTYTVTLAYQDAAANPSASAVSTGVTIDTVPPETTIDSGPSGTVTNRSATFTFSSSDAGASFQESLDGAPFFPTTSPANYASLGTGPHTFNVRAIDVAGNTDPTPATRSWSIEASLSALEQWRGVTFGVNSNNLTIAGNLADPDSDGVANIFEYAGGSNPLDPNSTARLSWAFEGGSLLFFYDRRVGATDVTHGVDMSDDLTTWSDASFTEEILSSTGGVEKVKATVALNITNPSEPKGFLRAKITVVP